MSKEIIESITGEDGDFSSVDYSLTLRTLDVFCFGPENLRSLERIHLAAAIQPGVLDGNLLLIHATSRRDGVSIDPLAHFFKETPHRVLYGIGRHYLLDGRIKD